MVIVQLVCCLLQFLFRWGISFECHSLRVVSRDLKIVIFSSLFKFMYCCLEIMLRFFKNYLVISKKECTDKSIIPLWIWICL